MCGENGTTTSRTPAALGSSPRVRGKPLLGAPVSARPGLIPACAGKTTARRKTRMIPGSSPRVRGKPPPHARPSPSSPAHPRVCGENAVAAGGAHDVPGSSPRVRGKLVGHHPRRARPGLIPACAGKTTGWRRRRSGGSAHPRVCGENDSEELAEDREWGSSPRVRGKLLVGYSITQQHRLIPACAGKTHQIRRASRVGVAHPRACGENQEGAHGGRVAAVAHPRVCGENSPPAIGTSQSAGSSPRVRGKQGGTPTPGPQDRLIPACAGKTT